MSKASERFGSRVALALGVVVLAAVGSFVLSSRGLLGFVASLPSGDGADAHPSLVRASTPTAPERSSPREEARARYAHGSVVQQQREIDYPTDPAARPPNYSPRPQDEWQGMLFDVNMAAPCDTTSRCGKAMACIDGKCVPCSSDSQCLAGERCVLDHCVRSQLVQCASRTDCKDEELCVLSGYSEDLRANGNMQARCLSPQGGSAPEEPAETQESAVFARAPVETEELLDELRRARSQLEKPPKAEP